MATHPVELPPRKRPRPEDSGGDGVSRPDADSPAVRATSGLGAGVYTRAEQPAATLDVDEIPDTATATHVGARRVAHTPGAGRDGVGRMVSLPVSAATDASPPSDGAQQPPPVCSPNIPATAFTAEALFERGLSMLTGEGERPAASGGLRKALAATLELLLAVCVAAERLWAEHEEAIRRCCGPSMPNGLIDGREVFAYLLNDVFGRPLLHADDAHGVAQRGANAVAKARRQTGGQKTTKAAHEAAMRIAARAAADGAPPAAVAAYQKLLGTYNLDLPARTVGRRVRLAEAGAATAAAAAETAAEAATAEAAAAEAAAEPVEASSKLDNLEKAERSARTAARSRGPLMRCAPTRHASSVQSGDSTRSGRGPARMSGGVRSRTLRAI